MQRMLKQSGVSSVWDDDRLFGWQVFSCKQNKILARFDSLKSVLFNMSIQLDSLDVSDRYVEIYRDENQFSNKTLLKLSSERS